MFKFYYVNLRSDLANSFNISSAFILLAKTFFNIEIAESTLYN